MEEIKVGDRVTYTDGYVGIVLDNEEINYQTVVRDREIIKVERIGLNGWEVVEEKKELLTEEEKEFLKDIVKFFKGRIKQIEKGLYAVYFVSEKGEQLINVERRTIFKGLEENKIYTLKELRIGGINYEFCKSRINTL